MDSCEDEKQNNEIVRQLKVLNEKVVEQNKLQRIFFMGIIHGIGFFIGSAIIATIALGALGPWIGQIDWVHDNFIRGEEMME